MRDIVLSSAGLSDDEYEKLLTICQEKMNRLEVMFLFY